MDQLKINEAILKLKPGLEKYLKIMGMVNKVDVSENKDFQKAFNGFYRVRQRPEKFYKIFYSFLEKNKNSNPSFEDILRHIYEEMGRVEASFSSKLVATINPDFPVWDTIVLKNLGLKPPSYSRKNRIEETISLYNVIIKWYQEFVETEKGRNIIELFDKTYPNTGITDVKKIDLVLWQIRE